MPSLAHRATPSAQTRPDDQTGTGPVHYMSCRVSDRPIKPIRLDIYTLRWPKLYSKLSEPSTRNRENPVAKSLLASIHQHGGCAATALFGTCALTRHAARGGPCLQSLHACTHARTDAHDTPPPCSAAAAAARVKSGKHGGLLLLPSLRASATDRSFQSIQPATKLTIPPGRAPARSIGRPRSKLELAAATPPGRSSPAAALDMRHPLRGG